MITTQAADRTKQQPRARRSPLARLLLAASTYATLLLLGLVMALPFLWMLSTALKPPGTAYSYPPQWVPDRLTLSNFPAVLHLIPFFTFLRNSVMVTGLALVGEVLSSSLVAYGFARFRFPGRDVLFLLVLATMMIPYPVTIIPTFMLFREIGWVNTFLPLIVPAFCGPAFYVFLLRQFFMTISSELDDAAKIDGASEFRIYWQILLPLAKPALATVAVFSFVANWNDFLGPLVYLSDIDKYTLALGINFLRAARAEPTDITIQMAGTLLFLLPCVLLFFLAQRLFIQGIVFTGIKG
ncbi:binding-protein-dependent transport systems inner membrane component [Thermobaculum terrenum ATCC BAA-798]|uniref:Binding-protein-dependent transport systems inner membrane component n=1 Tax=Thermobaculum terrenum (strain ATCC BAA-798 / CCMEE 7001 / YNP1) TaxID=525904 RepID=D1CI25_THET1|nr:carbohydrate ABC transporter permease [Thermobaculum terrenum]ACZ43396.1 binding-protein-dependent transport systems inner membrane component [Thermobaculum terrenum ATCC BAA-798]